MCRTKHFIGRVVITCMCALTASASGQLPVVDLNPEPKDDAQKQRRIFRSRLFNFPGPQKPLEELSPDLPPPIVILDFRPMPELPTAVSDAVVLGKVSDEQPYLSEDRKTLYTEYTV